MLLVGDYGEAYTGVLCTILVLASLSPSLKLFASKK